MPYHSLFHMRRYLSIVSEPHIGIILSLQYSPFICLVTSQGLKVGPGPR